MIDLDAALTHIASSPLLDGCDVRQLAVTEPAPIDLAAGLAGALMHPTGSPRLAEIARGKGSAAIITADATRAVPSRELRTQVCTGLRHGNAADFQAALTLRQRNIP